MLPRIPLGPDAPKATACLLSSRPLDLLMMARATPDELAAMRAEDLRILEDGLTLALGRERNRSLARHWSCDLNRHIALKRARDRIRAEIDGRRARTAPKRKKPRSCRGSLQDGSETL